MPDSVKSMGNDVFWCDSKLEEVKLSAKLTQISGYMFYGCTSLKSIIIPDNVRSIGNKVFYGCKKLETINFPKKLNSIGDNTFFNTPELKTINIDPENETFSIENGVLFGINNGDIIKILSEAVSGDTFIVPNGIKILNSDVLSSYTNITKVEIPDSVTLITSDFLNSKITYVTIDANNPDYKSDGSAIYSKDGKTLTRYFADDTTVYLTEGIEIIGKNAFYLKNKITSISFPDSLKELHESCLYGLSKLTSISLGENITLLNNRSIFGSGVETIIIDENNENYTVINEALYNKDGTIFISPIKKIDSITSYTIPNGVKEIEIYAFASQRKLSSITFPDTLEKINGNAFYNCTSLTSVEIPSSITSIAATCFVDCGVNLTEIIIHKPKGSITGAPWGCQYGDRAVKWDS